MEKITHCDHYGLNVILYSGRCFDVGYQSERRSFFDDPRNLQAIREAIEQAKRGQATELTPELKEKLFGDL